MYAIRTGIFAFALVLGLATSASAITFSFTTIDVPSSLGTVAQDINDSGTIVGGFAASPPAAVRQAFLLSGNTFTSFVVPDAPRTIAANTNNSGQIVGFFPTTQMSLTALCGATVVSPRSTRQEPSKASPLASMIAASLWDSTQTLREWLTGSCEVIPRS
jgi:hypothetical protein